MWLGGPDRRAQPVLMLQAVIGPVPLVEDLQQHDPGIRQLLEPVSARCVNQGRAEPYLKCSSGPNCHPSPPWCGLVAPQRLRGEDEHNTHQ